MNTTILKKCVDALAEKEPNISYIRGMLETLLAMAGPQPEPAVPSVAVLPAVPAPVVADIPGFPPVGNVNLIKDLAEKSTEQA